MSQNISEQIETITPLQIVRFDDNKKLIPCWHAIKRILLKNNIKNRYISIVSICGKMRQGKSFLLCCLLRYLYILYKFKRNCKKEWLDPKYGKILNGFPYRLGIQPETNGIVVWPKPFLTTVNDKKIAIILVDSQGAFDLQNTIDNSAMIFALGTLLSSVQIYNITNALEQDKLNYLETFACYGNFKKYNIQLFQKLLILIRDWRHTKDYPLGANGGNQYLNSVLDHNQSNSPDGLNEQRQNIKENFEEVSCVLVPDPGATVNSSYDFNGKLTEVNEEFLNHVEQLAHALFAPENLVLKKINGKFVTGSDLYTYFESYIKVCESGQLPTVKSIFEATATANCKIASEKSILLYRNAMKRILVASPYLEAAVLIHQHLIACSEALKKYDELITTPNSRINLRYKDDLRNLLEQFYKEFENINESNYSNVKNIVENKFSDSIDTYKNIITTGCQFELSYLKEDTLKQRNEEAKLAAISIFDSIKASYYVTELYKTHRAKLLKSLKNEFTACKLENSERFANLIRLLDEYRDESLRKFRDAMDGIFYSDDDFVSTDFLKAKCDEAKIIALSKFEILGAQLEQGSIQTLADYKGNLENQLEEIKNTYTQENERRKERALHKLDRLKVEATAEYIRRMNNVLNEETLPFTEESVLNQEHVEAQRRAFEIFDELQNVLGSSTHFSGLKNNLTEDIHNEFSNIRDRNNRKRDSFKDRIDRTRIESLNQYKSQMDKTITSETSVHQNSFASCHSRAKDDALKHFDRCTFTHGTLQLVQEAKDCLRLNIELEYQRYARINETRRADHMAAQRDMVIAGAGSALVGGLVGAAAVGYRDGIPTAKRVVRTVGSLLGTSSPLIAAAAAAFGTMQITEEAQESEDEHTLAINTLK